jgi:hypothetical protein
MRFMGIMGGSILYHWQFRDVGLLASSARAKRRRVARVLELRRRWFHVPLSRVARCALRVARCARRARGSGIVVPGVSVACAPVVRAHATD